jgi:competence ComEA-like helix-hairpin-helix protein
LILEKIKLKLYNIGFSRKEMIAILSIILVTFAGSVLKTIKTIFPETQKFDYFESDGKFLKYSQKNDSASGITEKQDSIIIKDLFLLTNTKPKKSAFLLDKKININNADRNGLMQLPGVGPKMADRILEYRKLNQGFKTINEFMNVKGIGRKKFSNVKKYIEIN